MESWNFMFTINAQCVVFKDEMIWAKNQLKYMCTLSTNDGGQLPSEHNCPSYPLRCANRSMRIQKPHPATFTTMKKTNNAFNMYNDRPPATNMNLEVSIAHVTSHCKCNRTANDQTTLPTRCTSICQPRMKVPDSLPVNAATPVTPHRYTVGCAPPPSHTTSTHTHTLSISHFHHRHMLATPQSATIEPNQTPPQPPPQSRWECSPIRGWRQRRDRQHVWPRVVPGSCFSGMGRSRGEARFGAVVPDI